MRVLKQHIVRRVKQQIDYVAIKDIDIIVSVVLDTIIQSIIEDKKVKITDFGVFGQYVRRGKPNAIDPRDGSRVYPSAKRVPFFRPATKLKQLVAEGGCEPEDISSI